MIVNVVPGFSLSLPVVPVSKVTFIEMKEVILD